MMIRNLPEDINVELLLDYLPEGSFKVAVKGLHKRNAYNDIIEVEERSDKTLSLGIARKSLYNVLPELLFHPIDRFNNLPGIEDEKKEFAEEYDKQEREIENAYSFFAPVDVCILLLRVKVREKLLRYAETNLPLINMLGDRLTEEQKNNVLVKQTIPFLPACKSVRGNKTLLTLMLRKIFTDEGMRITLNRPVMEHRDPIPRYNDSLGGTLGDTFAGNAFDEQTAYYTIHYWSDEKCDEYFMQFVDDVETFRLFVQDYFMSVEELLHFDISTDGPPLRLSDNLIYNYLDYNTNI